MVTYTPSHLENLFSQNTIYSPPFYSDSLSLKKSMPPNIKCASPNPTKPAPMATFVSLLDIPLFFMSIPLIATPVAVTAVPKAIVINPLCIKSTSY